MPAWMTSLLRELIPVPKPASDSRTSGVRPRTASSAATASPTTPAPITIVSTVSISGALLARPSSGGRVCSGGLHRDREVDRVGHEAVAMGPLVELGEPALVFRVELDAGAQRHRHETRLAVFLA